MTTLRKKIFHSKIENIILENNFVLFFQFNNVKFTDWIFLKSKIFNFQNINVIVIKNKISYKTFSNNKAKIEFFSPFNNSKLLFKINFSEKYAEYPLAFANQPKVDPLLNKIKPGLILSSKATGVTSSVALQRKRQSNGAFASKASCRLALLANKPCKNYKNYLSTEMCKNLSFNQEKLNFLCQGPTLVIHFNSINQCKAIYDILSQYTYNFSCTKSMFKSESFDSHKYKKTCSNSGNLPLLFLQKKSNLYLQKHNFIKKKIMKSTFFFIGGFFKRKMINHLDFEKLLQLDNSIYVNLITQYSNPIVRMFLFNVIVKIKFLKCFQNNLLSLLNIYKYNLKKKKLQFK